MTTLVLGSADLRTTVDDAAGDRRLQAHLERVLGASGHRELRELDITVRDGCVTLRGRVATYYQKQVAQSATLGTPGITGLRNELAVLSGVASAAGDLDMPQRDRWVADFSKHDAKTMASGGQGVLIADDDWAIRSLLQSWLGRNGFRVWTAADGVAAVEQYRKHAAEIAVVLLDVCMPELDGPATLDVLRLLNPGVVACFMTGDTGCRSAGELAQRQPQHVFAKPLLLDDLTDRLRQCCQSNLTSGPAL